MLAITLEVSATDFRVDYYTWLQAQYPGATIKPVQAVITAYCPCASCCGERTETTSTGVNTNTEPYGIAADPRMLPYGTQLHVPGYLTQSNPAGVWSVDDTGGALRRDGERGVVHIDVRYKNHTWARQQGVRVETIYIVER